MSIPFFLKPSNQYELVGDVRFYVKQGKPGDNWLLVAEQVAFDTYAPRFSEISKVARKIATEENISYREAFSYITGGGDEKGDDLLTKYDHLIKPVVESISSTEGMPYEETYSYVTGGGSKNTNAILVKYADQVLDLQEHIREATVTQKIQMVTVAISNRCWQPLEDDLKSATDAAEKAQLQKAIDFNKKWTVEHTKTLLTSEYIDDVFAFLETQRLGGVKPVVEAVLPSEDELKKGQETQPQTGEKSTGESENSGKQKRGSTGKTSGVSQSG